MKFMVGLFVTLSACAPLAQAQMLFPDVHMRSIPSPSVGLKSHQQQPPTVRRSILSPGADSALTSTIDCAWLQHGAADFATAERDCVVSEG